MTATRASNRERAAQLLAHYITTLMVRTGMRVDGDTYTELRECVDAIVDAALDEASDARREALGA